VKTIHLDHTPFARLRPSEKLELLEKANEEEFHFPSELETFVTSPTDRTYAVLRIIKRDRPDEYATFLVAFDHSRNGKPYFEDGRYGFTTLRSSTGAANDMYWRAI
jgi:hypothetical protein